MAAFQLSDLWPGLKPSKGAGGRTRAKVKGIEPLTEEGQAWRYGPVVVFAHLASKSNGRRNDSTGRSIKSEIAFEFADAFAAQVDTPPLPYLGPVKMTVQAYYPDRRRDLDISLLQDCIQKAGIIANDRLIEKIDAERWLDRAGPPRVIFWLEPWTRKEVPHARARRPGAQP